LREHAAVARPYRLWLGCCWGSITVGLLLRITLPTSTTDAISKLESINRHGVIVSIVFAAIDVAIAILGWPARSAIEQFAESRVDGS